MLLTSLLISLALAQDPAPDELPPLLRNPELTDFVQAPYPPEAQAEGLQGSVLLLIEIDETGKVSAVDVLRSLGNGFDEAAVEAAKQFVFTPAEDETGPVPVAIEFEYGFVLDVQEVEGAVPDAEIAQEVPVEAPVNVEGTLLEMATRRPLASMSVAIAGTNISTESDAEGHFEFRGVPAGTSTIVVARPGWETKETPIEIVEGELSSATIWVRNLSYNQDAAVGVYRREKDEVSRRTITINEVRRIPGTFGDPVRVIQNLPGAARSPFGSGLLIIRGANPEDSGVYVDGIRIPYIYHLGGYVSILNPDLVEAVDYLPGNYGVQYGRSTGGVVDVRTKAEAPEQARVTWSTDLLDSGGLYEGRLGKNGQHHVGVAARRSYVDVLLPLVPAYRKRSFAVSPRWQDYQLRYSYDGLPNTKISAFVFGFDDQLLASTPDDFAQGTDQDTQGDIFIRQWSHRALVHIEHDFSDTLTLSATPSFGYDYNNFGVGQEFGLTQLQRLWELRTELNWSPNDKFELIPGIDAIGGFSTFSFESPIDPQALLEYDPLAEREGILIEGDGRGWGPDAYIKANIRPLADPEALLITPGVRFSYVAIVDELTNVGLDPRIAVRARVTPKIFVKGATGLFSQPPQVFEVYHPNPDVGIDLTMEHSWSTTLGYEQRFGEAISVEVEGFYKVLSDVIVPNPDLRDLSTDQFNVNDGIGRIRGVEVMVRHEPVDRLFGWISYTYSLSERCDDFASDGCARDLALGADGSDWYLFDFDQTHILTALAGYKLPYEIEVSGRFQYVTGNPYTPYDQGVYDIDQDFYQGFSTGSRNAERMPGYTALDLRADKGFTFKKWRLDAYVDLLNVYHGVNPEFVQYNYDYTERAYVSGLPFIPSPGVGLEVFL